MTERVRCVYCLNNTAEITKDGLKCVHPYCGKEWSFEFEQKNRKQIFWQVGRPPVSPPKPERKAIKSDPLPVKREPITRAVETKEDKG